MAPHELLNKHGTLTGLRPVLHEVFVVLVRSVRAPALEGTYFIRFDVFLFDSEKAH